MTGKFGTVTRNFRHIRAQIELKDKDEKGNKYRHFEISSFLQTYKQCAVLNTIATHIRNMITGVTKGYRYKMHLVKKHFPIEININNEKNCLEIGRFLGGREVKCVGLLDGVKVQKNEKNSEELWFDSPDVVTVSLNCSHVQQSCKVKDKDIRMFLDGIYVSEKTNIEKE